MPIRVETGAYHGKPIYFSIIAPWTKPSRMEAEGMGTGQSIGNAMLLVVLFGLLELYLGISGGAPGIANFAHLGGMLFGFLLIRHWKNAARRR